MIEPKIKFENVSKKFQNQSNNNFVVKDINFEIFAEEFVCLLGPSGVGKSTIFGLIAGFIKPSEGKVLFNSKEIKRPDSSRTLVFQDYALFPWLNVIENVSFGLTTKNIPKKEIQDRAIKYLELVGLQSYKDYSISNLSGGMKQRVALARALAVEPEVLLLDEPFGALDQQTRELMQNELLRIWSQSKKTVIFITHSVDEALLLADRIIVVGEKPGKILLDITIGISRPRNLSNEKLVTLRSNILEKFTQPEIFLGAGI